MITIKNKQWVIFKNTLLILIIIFLLNLYSINNGYYESKINKKTKITQENINEFEKDIKNNEYIDLKNYNKDEYIDTNNTTSKIAYNINENISNLVTKQTKKIFKFIKSLFS